MPKGQPPQKQKPPEKKREMDPQPESENPAYMPAGKLKDKIAIITGGDSGIGTATAIAFAKEGASIVVVYLSADEDAKQTKKRNEVIGQKCVLIKGDLGNKQVCLEVAGTALNAFMENRHSYQQCR